MDFNACDLDYLEKTFGLMPVPPARLAALAEWLNSARPINEAERYEANELRELLELNVMHWNEQELSLHCIGPIFSIPKFTIVRKMNLFAQRQIAAAVPDAHGNLITLSGRPDGMLASGFRSPDKPFFCFQEYKKEKDPNGDPGGQCLAAMLVGQALNGNLAEVVYGCYVIGQNWHFMTLKDEQYTISPAFSAQTDEIYFIIGVLKRLKEIVAARIG
jgi:hypothetical protein